MFLKGRLPQCSPKLREVLFQALKQADDVRHSIVNGSTEPDSALIDDRCCGPAVSGSPNLIPARSPASNSWRFQAALS